MLAWVALTSLKAQNFGSQSRLYVGYVSVGDCDGAQLGYMHSSNIIDESIPLLFQLGVECNWATHSSRGVHLNIANIAVPANLAYCFNLIDAFSIEPFIGLNLRGNILSKVSYRGESIDYFDEFDAKRFQVGMNFGVGLNVNNYYIGYRYNPDLTKYIDYNDLLEGTTKYHFVTVGINF